MSEFKAQIIALRDRAPAGVTEFLQSNIDETTLVAFVEGKDDKAFYIQFLRRITYSDNLLVIKCGNKSGVIRAFNFLKRLTVSRECEALLFICDRDFDIFT